MTMPLIQEWTPLNYTLEEGKDGGKTILRGEFGRVDVPTQNKRFYSRALTQREINRLNEDLTQRRVYGELDHPSDGKTKYQRVSHIITDLKIESDGRVVGEAEVLDTPNGRIVEAIAKANGGLGVSSRGFGSVTTRQDGVQEVGEDFRLKTYDIVVDPAMKTAHPEVFAESLMESNDYDWVAELKADFPHLVEEIAKEEAAKAKEAAEKAVADAIEQNTSGAVKEQREEFERRLAEVMSKLREEVSDDLREEYEADPANGAAKTVLEQIASLVAAFKPDSDEQAVRDALKAKDVELAKVNESVDQWRDLSKKLGYQLCIERETVGHPMQETIVAALGDVMKFESMEALKAAVEKVRDDLDEVIPNDDDQAAREESEAVAGKNGEIRALKEQLSDLEERYGELSGKFDRALQLAESLQTKLTTETDRADAFETQSPDSTLSEAKLKAVVGFVNAPQLLEMLEDVTDKNQIKSIVEMHGSKTISDSTLEQLRQKLTRGNRHDGADTLQEDGEPGPVNQGSSASFMDQTAAEILELADVVADRP